MTFAPNLTRRHLSPELLATTILVVAYIFWLLSMPVWPSQDGPVHLYYTQILGALLSHHPNAYAQYFNVRHLLPPYSLYYYALLGLSKLVPLATADRFIICVYIVSFVFGFRYVARALGPASDLTTLLATLLLLNWSLGMGFINFCLSLSFALWALGLWLRFGDRHDLLHRAGFVALGVIIMLTHPIPLALVLAVCASFWIVELFTQAENLTPRARLRDLLTLAITGSTLIYVKLFTTSHLFEQVLPESGSLFHRLLHRALIYAREDGVVFLFGQSAAVHLYRIAIGLLLLITIALSLWQCFRDIRVGVWTNANTLSCLGLFLLVALPLIPSQLNGLFYFADRLPLIVWIALLLAASGSSVFSTLNAGKMMTARLLIIGFAVIANAALLYAAERTLRPIARSIAAIDRSPVELAGQVGFIFEDPRPPSDSHSDYPSWGPYYWAAIDLIRHNGAILANAPWMDETILPVGPTRALPEEDIPALQTPVPKDVPYALLKSPKDLDKTLASVNFFVVAQNGRPLDDSAGHVILRMVASQQSRWSCQSGPIDWYRLCSKQPQ
jgi:hypothetical protein